ncbi:MAG: ABC transporter permease [Planctomycetes bacterium]|nr:ABC transporter permease [Planctomycetota bacterium]MCB9918428.1 ABC transporter permease [Planctomycetota bacterium]
MTVSHDFVHSYDTATAKHGFWQYAFQWPRYFSQVVRSRALFWNFARRELLSRFRGSAGGIFWVLIQPIFQFAIYFFVFGFLFEHRTQTGGPSTDFAIYLFSGILIFNTLMEGTTQAMQSVVSSSNLVKKVAFPCELLPLSPVIVSQTVYLVGCVVLLTAGLITGDIVLSAKILAWPLVFLCALVMSTGIGLLLAATNVFARDIAHLYRIVAQAWFFMTPIFWPLDLVAQKVTGAPWILNIMLLNPAYPVTMAARQVIGLPESIPPSAARLVPMTLTGNLIAAAIWASVLFVVGYGFFMSRKHKFADLV